jgi:hypothetical protein
MRTGDAIRQDDWWDAMRRDAGRDDRRPFGSVERGAAITAGVLTMTCALVPLKPKALTPQSAPPRDRDRTDTFPRRRRSECRSTECAVKARDVEVRRDHAVIEGEDGLHQPGHAGRCFEMPDVRPDRSDPERGLRASAPASAPTSIVSPRTVPVPCVST